LNRQFLEKNFFSKDGGTFQDLHVIKNFPPINSETAIPNPIIIPILPPPSDITSYLPKA
jgi:hypothetical protein